MPFSEYVVGWVWFGLIAGGAGWTATVVVVRRLAWMALEARVVAWGLLALAAIAASTGVPLALGVLSRPAAAVSAVLLAAAASLAVKAVARPTVPEAPGGRPSGRAAWIVAGLMAVVAGAYLLAYLKQAAVRPVQDIDSTTFILPTLAQWLRTGSLWETQDFVAGWGFAAYPNTGGLVQVAAILPWDSDFAIRAVSPLLVLLGAGATYALAAELGASRAIAAAAATLGMMLPAAVVSGISNVQTDALVAAMLPAGVLFGVRHARTGRSVELVLGALAFGIAFGTKWYGPPQVAALLAVWVAVRLLARHPPARVLRQAVAVGLAAAALGAVWLVRNAVRFGDPLFPAGIAPLGIEPPDGLLSAPLDFSLLHYAFDFDVLTEYVFEQFVTGFSAAGGLALVGALIAAVAAARSRDGRALGVAAGALAVLAVYTAMPYSALGPEGEPILVIAAARYAVPGLLLAFAASAWLVTRLDTRVQAVAAVAGLAGLAHAIERYSDLYPVGGFDVGLLAPAAAAVGVVILGACAWLLRARPAALVAAGVLVAVLAFAGGRRVEQRFADSRYAGIDPGLDHVNRLAADGTTVGLAGETGQEHSVNLVAFGPRFDRDVIFVGPVRDELQQRDSEERAFAERLRAAGVDLLVVSTAYGRASEVQWAQEAGWRRVARSERYVVLKPPRT